MQDYEMGSMGSSSLSAPEDTPQGQIAAGKLQESLLLGILELATPMLLSQREKSPSPEFGFVHGSHGHGSTGGTVTGPDPSVNEGWVMALRTERLVSAHGY
jgi:hypothetical protein